MRPVLLDEMLSLRVAEQLSGDGVDVVAVSAVPDLRGSPDGDVLDLAARQGRVLVTDNIRDFAALDASWSAQGRTHAGIVYVSAKAYPHDRARTGRLVAALLERAQADRWPGPGAVDFL